MKLVKQKIKLTRYSRLPLNVSHMNDYKEEFNKLCDESDTKFGKFTQENAKEHQEFMIPANEKLIEKFPFSKEVEYPMNLGQLKNLITEWKHPIAFTLEKGTVHAVILDSENIDPEVQETQSSPSTDV